MCTRGTSTQLTFIKENYIIIFEKFKMKFYLIFLLFLPLLTVGSCLNNTITGDMIIGGPCDFANDCVGNPTVSSDCIDGLCVCKAGYLPTFLLDDCLAITGEIGGDCEEDRQCQQGTPGRLSECVDKKCACANDAVNEPGQHVCYEVREELGEQCDVHAQCRKNMGIHAQCFNQECVCDLALSVIKSDNQFCLPKVHTIETDQCEETPQCTQGTPGSLSECTIRNTCSCFQNATHEVGGHTCLPKADFVGAGCTADVQCTENLGELSKCIDKMCICPEASSIPSLDRGKCLKIINEIGTQECEENQQCTQGIPGPYSSCALSLSPPPSPRKICDCNPNSINEPGRHICYLKADNVGDSCEVLIQCVLLGELSRCNGDKCICPPLTSVPSGDTLRCLGLVNDIGGNCTENQQCNSGSPGEFSECSDGKCGCKEDSTHEDGGDICYPIADEVGGGCQVDVQCKSKLGDLSHCENGLCTCVETAVPSSDRSRCLPLIDKIGGGCEEKQQCTGGLPGEYSECILDAEGMDMICRCNYYSIPNEDVCLRKATLVGDPCNITQQCTENLSELSLCSDHELPDVGNCICKPGAVGNVGQTRCVYGGIPIGSPCQDDFQCMGTPGTSECSSGICGCKQGLISSIDLSECLPIVNVVGESCKEIHQCQQGDLGLLSECVPISPIRSICNCSSEAVTEPGQNRCRLKATYVGDACEVQSQCLANLVHSQCLNDSCTCLGNATASTDNKQCLLKSFLNLPCQDQNQCSWMSQGASCLQDPILGNICRCDSNYVNPPGVVNACYSLAPFLGRSCADHPIQCNNLENALCLPEEKLCGCDNTTRVESLGKKKCLLQVERLNMTCSESPQCVTPNSECRRETNQTICRCRVEDYVESLLNPGNCLKIINEIRSPCEEQQQCTSGLGPLSECRDGLCWCRNGYAFSNGRCYYPSSLGGPCNADGECQVGVNNFTICENSSNSCRCIENAFQYEDMCYMQKYVGDACNTRTECQLSILGMVNCDPITGRCTCLPGYSNADGGRECSGAGSHIANVALFAATFIFAISNLLQNRVESGIKIL